MNSDEGGAGPWMFDPETLAALRLQKAQEALDRDDPDLALVEAEEFLARHPEDAEALRICGRAALQMGDALLARSAAEHLALRPEPSLADLLMLVAARFECADLEGALAAADSVLAREPKLAEAWYQRALILERLGLEEAAGHAARQATALDPEAYPALEPVGEEVWQAALDRGLRSLPGPIRSFYANVPVRWERFPTAAELTSTTPPLSPFVDALYAGAPPEGGDPWIERPPFVRLFRGNLDRPSPDLPELARRIGHALLQEAVDWLGITEAEPWGRS